MVNILSGSGRRMGATICCSKTCVCFRVGRRREKTGTAYGTGAQERDDQGARVEMGGEKHKYGRHSTMLPA